MRLAHAFAALARRRRLIEKTSRMYATLSNIWFLIAAGVVTGVLGAILGTGGGVFLIPLLLLAVHVPMHYAVATSIISVVATSTRRGQRERGTGYREHAVGHDAGNCHGIGGDLRGVYRRLVAGASSGNIVCEFAITDGSVDVARRDGECDGESRSTMLGRKRIAQSVAGDGASSSEFICRFAGGTIFRSTIGQKVYYRIQRLWAGLGISFIAGNLSGLLGIGGGVFKVPALHLACGVPIKAAAATSNFMIGVTATASAFLYFGRGEVRPALTAGVALGVIAGSAIGSWLGPKVQGRVVKKLFALLLLGVAVQMLVRVFG